MRVFVLGGTGQIGSAVLAGLKRRGHTVLALARSPQSAEKAARLGAKPLSGDIMEPGKWVSAVPPVDAVIHAAQDLASPMEEVNRHLLDALLPHLTGQLPKARYIFTGGNWLFGATDGAVADEDWPFAPPPSFAWMLPGLKRILESEAVDGIVIHPVMVYAADGGGVFRRFRNDATGRAAVRVVASEAVRWPLVRDDDLADLYALALEKAPPGSSYIGGSIDGLEVGRIARAFAKRFATRRPDPEIVATEAVVREQGEWASGLALDQVMSGAKARRELGWSAALARPAFGDRRAGRLTWPLPKRRTVRPRPAPARSAGARWRAP